MQSKNSKIQTKPIEDLIGRIRALKQSNAPDLRISKREAEQLADSLTQVLARLVHVQDEIIDALKTAQQASTVNIEMDGGEFDSK
tara:strand:+ start:128 stop:382 length:255 start_codon:yes stop_codon:yes gene_type:complete